MTGHRTHLLALALLCSLPALSQRLAQRNWQGSGLTAQTWWPRATLCSLDLRKDRTRSLPGVVARLDEFQSMGCEALVLDILAPASGAGSTISLTFGTLDDSDNLIEQMGRRKMRLILNLPPHPEAEATSKATLDQMRFWLSRGVAGFVLPAEGDSTLAHQAHQVAASALGTRILIGDTLASPAPAVAVRRAVALDLQLALKRLAPANDRASIEALRTALSSPSNLPPLPLLTLDDASATETPIDPESEFALHRAQAAVLLASGPAAMLPLSTLMSNTIHSTTKGSFSPEELGLWIPAGGDPLGPSPQQEFAEWLHSLNDLRHTSPALRTGTSTYVDLDLNEFLVWIVRPKGPGVPLLFVCNLSSSAAHVSLGRELHDLGVRASSLKTVLRTDPDPSQPPATLDDIALDANGVFVGELR